MAGDTYPPKPHCLMPIYKSTALHSSHKKLQARKATEDQLTSVHIYGLLDDLHSDLY